MSTSLISKLFLAGPLRDLTDFAYIPQHRRAHPSSSLVPESLPKPFLNEFPAADPEAQARSHSPLQFRVRLHPRRKSKQSDVNSGLKNFVLYFYYITEAFDLPVCISSRPPV
jgi:hypothetical protein